jgi:MFS transporter, ACS family, glucarate transporter
MKSEATRVRYGVLALVSVLSMITYLDRACFGVAAPIIASELSLPSVADLKWVFTAFAIAYAVFEIPAGWLGDVWGPRSTLIRIVIWWSLFTALTGVVGLKYGSTIIGGLGTLIVLRLLFGAGEAGAYPNITRALHNWFPADRAATAQGWVWMSGRLAGGLTPLIWMLLVAGTSWTAPIVSWRGAFLMFGLVGVIWCVVFALFFRNHPRTHRLVNQAELQEIERNKETAEAELVIPWASFLRSTNLYLLCLMYFCMVYGWYFNITYLPSYLRNRYQLEPSSVVTAIYQGAPLWIGALSCLAGGLVVDWLMRRTGNRRKSRRILGVTAEGMCALCWLAATLAPNVHLFVAAVALAALCNDMTLASAWATCQDIGQRFTAVTSACMNTIGTVGAALSGWMTGSLIQYSLASRAAGLQLSLADLSASEKRDAELTGFQYSFLSYVGVYIVSMLCWRFIDADKPIVSEPKSSRSRVEP